MPGHIYCRQRNSGEAEVVGGDDLFERFPPAEQPLPEVVLRRGVLLRRANVRRRRMLGGRANSGEAALVGGDNLFGRCSPAEQPLTVGRRQLRRVGCSSELALRRGGQLRGANVGRRIPFRGDIFTRLIESGTFLADDVIQYQLSIGVSWNARDNRREYWKLPIKK